MMAEFLFVLKNIGDNIIEAVYPVTLITGGVGLALFLYQAFHQKEKKKIHIFVATTAYFFFFITFGFFRCSNRYFLLLLLPTIFFCGYLFREAYQKKPVLAYALLALFIVSFTLKHLRIDHGVGRVRTYLSSLSNQTANRTALFFALENREARRGMFYSKLPLATLTQYDFRNYDETMLQQLWQRYLYEYDDVYLEVLLPTKAKWHPSGELFQKRCDFRLDFETSRGTKKRKTFQVFRLSNADDHVAISPTATSAIPLKDEPNANICRWCDYKITPQWYVTDHALSYVNFKGTHYQVQDFQTHWEIFMTSDHSSCLRTNAIDLSTPFYCYIEYYGDADAPLDINLTMQREKKYRDNTVAYLPLRGDSIKKCIKLSFYPSMNPENLKAFLLFRLPAKGHVHITRLAFERVW